MPNIDYSQFQQAPAIDYSQFQSADAPETFGQRIDNFAKQATAIPGDIATGIAKGAYQGVNMLAKALPSPDYWKDPNGANKANYAPNPGISNDIPAPGSFNQQDSPIDTAVQNYSKIIPYMAAGEASVPAAATDLLGNIAKDYAIGSTYGGSQGGNPIEDGILNAAIPLGVKGTVMGLQAAGSGIKNKIANTVWPAVLDKFFSQSQSPEATLTAAEQAYRNNYANAAQDSDDLFNGTRNYAAAADQELGTGEMRPEFLHLNPYDNSSYLSSLNDIKSGLYSSNAPASAQGQIQKLINTAPDTFAKTIDARQAINKINVDYSDPSSNDFKSAVNQARSALLNNVDENLQKLSNNSSVQNFAQTWQDANNHYANNVMPFLQSYDKDGMLTESDTLTNALKGNTDNTHGDILQEFNPATKSNNDANMQHMANLIGDPKLAQDAQKAMLFQGAFNNGVPAPAFLTKYKGLSDSQRNQMFNPQEQQALNTIQSKAMPTVSSKEEKKTLGNFLLQRVAVPAGTGLVAGVGGHFLGGIPWEGAAALGAGVGGTASLVGKNSLSSYYAGNSLKPFNNLTSQKLTGQVPYISGAPVLPLINQAFGGNQ